MWGKVCPNRAEQSTATTSLIPGFKQGENAICPSQSWQEYPNPTTQYHLLYAERQYGRTWVRCTEQFQISRCTVRLTLQYGSEIQSSAVH